MYKLLSRFVPTLLFLAMIAFGSTKALATNTQISVNGWNGAIHLPSGYDPTGATKYPTIIFFPGAGEQGTNYGNLIKYGPNAYITGGWNGQVTVGGQVTKFIVVSLQPSCSNCYPSPNDTMSRIQALLSTYPAIDQSKIYLTGLSRGGWMSNTFAIYKPSANDYSYIDLPVAVVNVEGETPVDSYTYGFAAYDAFYEAATHAGGLRELTFEQKNDGRNHRDIVDHMTEVTQGKPGSAVYIATNFGGGAHCCWNSFYGSNTGTAPTAFVVDGCSQNIYEWFARQGARNAPLSSVNCGADNNPPTASSPDVAVMLPSGQSSVAVTLHGIGSDSDGDVLTYQWRDKAGWQVGQEIGEGSNGACVYPSTLCGYHTVGSDGTVTTTALAQGTYTFIFRVIDSKGAVATDFVTVTVLPYSATNTPPTANAGNDLTIQLPTNSVTLQGSGTDTDGTIASYAWTKTAGPSSGFITSPSSASTTVTNLGQGAYTFQLKVTDNQGAIGTDTVNVNVQPAANPNPVLIARYRMDADSVIWSNTTAEIRDDFNIRHGDAVSQTTASPFNTTPVTGEAGQALQFLPGIPGGYITLGSQPDLFNPTSNYTISLWLKRDGAAKSDANLLISQGENNGRQMSLYYRSDGVLYSTVGGQTIWGTELTTPVATLGVWYHIALVNQDGTQTLYVNGVPIAEGVSGTATATNKAVFIGERLSATGTLSKSTKYESLDDIRFYTGALSGEEIEALANTQLIDACPNISGNQVTVPAGYYADNTGSCWPIVDSLVGIELTPTSAGTIDSDLSARNLQPGSTIVIPAGSYTGGITLSGIHGSARSPIVIKNSSTGAVETSKITITDSTYFTLSGTGASGAKYGFKVYGPSGVSVTNGTSDYEVNNIEVYNATNGLTLKVDPKKNDTDTVYPNFTIKNVNIHNNWLHDISGAGILAGYPATGKVGNLVPVRLDNVEVAYNLLENIGETAVQLTNTRDETNVHDNLIKNYATKATQNQFAISIANANARVNNNTIDGGSGPAIQLRTYGINNAGGNVIKNVMTKPMNKQAATISGQEQSAYEKDNPRMRLDAVENIIQQDFTGPAISSSTLALTGAVTNNLLCGITKLSLDNLVIASKGSDMSGNQLNTEKCASVPETPKEVSSAANEAVVTATTLNVRQSTSTESAIVGKLAQGTTVTMSQTQDSAIAPGWTAITSPIKGVVSSQYLDNAGASVKASNLTAGTTVQATTAVNIRVSPTTSSRIVDRLYKGQNATVYALSPVSDWLQVRTSSGRTGYVFAQYVVPVKK